MVSIKKCVCSHEYQDKKYGSHMRVANSTGTGQTRGCRCTVCGKDITNDTNKIKK